MDKRQRNCPTRAELWSVLAYNPVSAALSDPSAAAASVAAPAAAAEVVAAVREAPMRQYYAPVALC